MVHPERHSSFLIATEHDEHPEGLFIGLFWSVVGSLVLFGLIALGVVYLAG